MTLWKTTFPSPVGPLHVYASDRGLRALLWRPATDDGPQAVECSDHPTLVRLAQQLEEYFAGARREFDVPLDPVGTEFQRLAWNALRTIPYGATRTYAEQAAAIGRPKAMRAVGAANGKNPISIVVPCHRVIGANGTLVGFGGGLETKRFLLDLEAGQRQLHLAEPHDEPRA